MSDYISREAALDHIRDYIEEYSWHTDEHGFHSPEWCAMKEAEMVLTDLPAADVQPAVKATWVVKEMEALFSGMDEHPVFACSECGYQIYDLLDNVKERHHYCPNCGAMMEES